MRKNLGIWIDPIRSLPGFLYIRFVRSLEFSHAKRPENGMSVRSAPIRTFAHRPPTESFRHESCSLCALLLGQSAGCVH